MRRCSAIFCRLEKFAGYVEYFLHQNIVADGCSRVDFFLRYDEFRRSPLPQKLGEYRQYTDATTAFLCAQNERIACWWSKRPRTDLGVEVSMDERELIDFETPYVLSESFPDRVDAPGELRRCSQCGGSSQPLPASELTVIKHHVGGQPLGHLRLYCRDHLAATKEWDASGGPGRSGPTGPMCLSCFVTVPLGTGICETCGEAVK